MKKFSFLYADKDASAERRQIDRFDGGGYDFGNVVKDLNIRGVSEYTGMDTKDIDYVMGIIGDINTSTQDVRLRYEILSDFIEAYGAFDSIQRQIGRFDSINAALVHAKKNMNRVHADLASDSKNTLNYNRLVLACEFLSKTYLTVVKIHSDLKFLQFKSHYLNNFFKFIDDLMSGSDFQKLHEECEIFCNHLNEGVIFDADIKMNDILRIISVKVADFRYVKPVKHGVFYSVMRALNLEENKSKNRLIYIEKSFTHNTTIAPSDDAYLKSLIQGEINLTAKRLAGIYETLIDLFTGISQELVFYSYALRTIDYMKKIGASYCIPKIAPDGSTRNIHFKDLYDVSLAGLIGAENGKIVKNDFSMGQDDCVNIVIGANQSGKTTFLRSFGIAMIFARSGLPIPAYDAEIAFCGKIYTHFQRYDADLVNQGQLDIELAEMEQIVYSVSENDLILMNESFSSTGYKDALRISGDVIAAFSRIRCGSIFITHIQDLADKLRSNGNISHPDKIRLYKTELGESGLPTYKLNTVK